MRKLGRLQSGREATESRLGNYMLGQFFDPFALRGAVGIVFADGVVVLAVVEEVDVAALAIAAPLPASKPVAARVATRGLIPTMLVHLLSLLSLDHLPHGCEIRRKYVRVRYEKELMRVSLTGPLDRRASHSQLFLMRDSRLCETGR